MFKNKFFWWDTKWHRGFEYSTAKECYKAALAERRTLISYGESVAEIQIWINGRMISLPGLNSPIRDVLDYEDVSVRCYNKMAVSAKTIEEFILKLQNEEIKPNHFGLKTWWEIWEIITKYNGHKYIFYRRSGN